MTGRLKCVNAMAVALVLAAAALLATPGALAAVFEPAEEAAQPPSLYFFLSVGREETPEKSALRSALMEPLLARLVGSEATASCHQLADRGTHESFSGRRIPDDAAFAEILQRLRKLRPNSIGSPAAAFKEMCRELASRLATPSAQEVQLWFIEQRAPLSVKLNEDLEAQNPADPLKYAADQLVALLTGSPGLQLHFVFVDGADSSRDGGASGMRFDDYLRMRLNSATDSGEAAWRVLTHMLSSGPEEPGRTGGHSVVGVVRGQWGAGVAGAVVKAGQGARANEWLLAFDKPSPPGTGAALAYVSYPANAGAAPNVYFERTEAGAEGPAGEGAVAAAGASEAMVGAKAAWLVLRDTPDKGFRVRLAFPKPQPEDAAIGMFVYHVLTRKNAWLLPDADTRIPWQREEHELTVGTDALAAPMEEWQVELLLNGEPLEAPLEALPAMDGQPYQWKARLPALPPGRAEFQARLTLREPGMMTLQTDLLATEIVNRLPEPLRDARLEYKAIFDVPHEAGAEAAGGTLRIDLNSLFADPDGDGLSFRMFDLSAEKGIYEARIDGHALSYVPGAVSAAAADFLIYASDGYGWSQEPANLRVTQHSLRENMETWRFLLTEEAKEGAFPSDEGALSFRVHEGIPLSFRFEGEAARQSLALYEEARRQLGLPAIGEALKVSLAEDPGFGKAECQVTVESDGDGVPRALALACALPAQERSMGDRGLAFTASCLQHALPELMPKVTLRVANAPPTLRLDASRALSGEIDGAPGRRVTRTLSGLLGGETDLFTLFDDEESLEKLTFMVTVRGLPVRLYHNNLPLDPAETPDGGSSVYRLEGALRAPADAAGAETGAHDGEAAASLLEIGFLDAGEAAVSVAAFDGEYYSGENVTWSVRLRSSHTRIAWTAAGVALGVLAALSLAFLLIWRAKPDFKGRSVRIEAVSRLAGGAGGNGVSVALDAYGKRSVPLSTLLIACRQPPLKTIGIETLADIRLRPARNAAGILACGTRAAKTGLRVNGRRLAGKMELRADQPAGISAGGDETLVLEIHQGDEVSFD